MSFKPTSYHWDWQSSIYTDSAPRRLRGADRLLSGFAAHAHLDLSSLVYQESQRPAGHGAYCDVYRGLLIVEGKHVAIKRFREYVFGGESEKFTKVR